MHYNFFLIVNSGATTVPSTRIERVASSVQSVKRFSTDIREIYLAHWSLHDARAFSVHGKPEEDSVYYRGSAVAGIVAKLLYFVYIILCYYYWRIELVG